MELKNKVKVKDYIHIKDFSNFQGNLKKKNNQKEIETLASSILENGYTNPIALWKNGTQNLILDGHQRLSAIQLLEAQGNKFKNNKIPVFFVDAETEKEARSILLQFNTTHSEFDLGVLIDFSKDLKIDNLRLNKFEDVNFNVVEELKEAYTGKGLDFPEQQEYRDAEFKEKIMQENYGEIESKNYSRKIETPIYEIKGEKPEIKDLFDNSKTLKLQENIDKSNISEEIKEFLRYGTERHTVFNYSKIAEFYAHSDKETQKLMEESALVIIDFNKAIENGFVELSEDIAKLYNK